MNFNEIEDKGLEIAGEDARDIYHKIFQNCQPFLQQINNEVNHHTLYRGITGLPDSDNPETGEPYANRWMGTKQVRLDGRKPLDTYYAIHDDFNKWFEEHYGHPYRNGLFVSGTSTVAEAYGSLRAVFPIGKFEYLWHPKIADLHGELVQDSEEHWKDYASHLGLIADDDEDGYDAGYELSTDVPAGDLLDFVIEKKFGKFKNDDLVKGIHKARTEIMIWVQEYYYLHPSYLQVFEEWLSK